MRAKTARYEELKAELMKSPEFQEEYEKLEPAYQVARLRMLRGLTQAELAGRIGTKQSSIARLESGSTQPSLSFLRRVAKALGARLEVRIVPDEEAEAAESAYPARQPREYPQAAEGYPD